MMTTASRFDDPEGGYVVRRPRASDAIGGALHRSFAASAQLPDDLHRLVDRLDRYPPRR